MQGSHNFLNLWECEFKGKMSNLVRKSKCQNLTVVGVN